MKKIKNLLVILKGVAMGAADVVPGVSGGTIAFITGIYEELLTSIKNIDLTALKLLGKFQFREFWSRINGTFLLCLVGGIAISIFSLAKLMTYLLETQPIATWSFFFGLIIASSILVSRDITRWKVSTIISMIAGIVVAYYITIITPASTPETWWFIMLSGSIAICAMILPGISGAFILLLMGKYSYMMEAVANLDIFTILLFVIGAIVGIISFSNVLTWLLKRFKTATIALLTGFMLGSLNKLWPWKEVVETYADRHGAIRPLVEKNVLPDTFFSLSGQNPQILTAIMMCAAGIILIMGIDMISRNLQRKNSR